jgi:hypothetical protein
MEIRNAEFRLGLLFLLPHLLFFPGAWASSSSSSPTLLPLSISLCFLEFLPFSVVAAHCGQLRPMEVQLRILLFLLPHPLIFPSPSTSLPQSTM